MELEIPTFVSSPSLARSYDRLRPQYPASLFTACLGRDRHAGSALDVGCGTGFVGRELKERGFNVIGVEINPHMARLARRYFPVLSDGFETVQFEDTFDLICSGQAWHWLDPAIRSEKAYGLLKPDGALILLWNETPLESEILGWLKEYESTAREAVVDDLPDPSTGEVFTGELLGAGFDVIANHRADHSRSYSIHDAAELIATMTYIARLPAEVRDAVLARVTSTFPDPVEMKIEAHAVVAVKTGI